MGNLGLQYVLQTVAVGRKSNRKPLIPYRVGNELDLDEVIDMDVKSGRPIEITRTDLSRQLAESFQTIRDGGAATAPPRPHPPPQRRTAPAPD